MNRLADATSPYLRQHRDNPVDWYPWGDEAFERARAEDKPVLLSVGYSACHWCHVMAHESFEDPEVARIQNELFVSVKVDREERPDVDAVYMDAVQALSGAGGWPMTVFLTPEGKPFFGGTYFPPRSKYGRPGFVELMEAVADAWQHRRVEVVGQADQLSEAIRQHAGASPGPAAELGPQVLEGAYAALRSVHDAEWGGFGRAPKFPQPHALDLLLRAWHHNRSDETMQMVTTSLDAMASGGMYDHLGGGFSRYSTDAFWMVPHFEKMLYDQASLVRAYLHGWQATGHERWGQVVAETVGYVLRDLRHPDGGFYSAEDADSEGEEGKFYVWRVEEVAEVCGPDADAAIAWYGVTRSGNFEGANILHRPVRGDLLRPPEVERARAALFDRRLARVRPGLDDKVLTEWNGWFISSLAEAGAAMGRAEWVGAAVQAAEFLLARLRRDDGRWLRTWSAVEDRAQFPAYAGDYAALVDAFTRLGEATGQARWITEARTTADAMLELFWDASAGGLFTTGHDAEQLIVRSKETYDGATPSANSTAAVALVRLGALTGEERYLERADAILASMGGLMSGQPTAVTAALAAVDLLVSGTTEVAVVGERPDLVAAAQALYLPNAVFAWGEPYPSPLWEGRTEGVAYVCEGFACKNPAADVDTLRAQLSGDVRRVRP